MVSKSKLKRVVEKYGLKTVSNVISSILTGTVSVPKATVTYNLKADVGKNGFFGSNYYLDVVLATSDFDLEGQKFSEDFLKYIAENYDVINGYFTEEHFTDSTPDFFAKDLKYENGKLIGKAYFNKEKDSFKSTLKLLKDKKNLFGLSLGLKNVSLTDDLKEIVKGDVVEFIITKNPANKNNKIM